MSKQKSKCLQKTYLFLFFFHIYFVNTLWNHISRNTGTTWSYLLLLPRGLPPDLTNWSYHFFLPPDLTTWSYHLFLPPVLTICSYHLLLPLILTTCSYHLLLPPGLITWSYHLVLSSGPTVNIFWVNYEKIKNMFWRLLFTAQCIYYDSRAKIKCAVHVALPKQP